MTQPSFTIRQLGYSDLPQVISVERRAFSAPWSLAMFVLELSKPSGLCLAAVDAHTSKLVGYLVLSRYDTVWHLMNIAVDPLRRREGIARGMLEEMFERAGPDEQYTLEVRTSNAPAIALYEHYGFRPAGRRPRYYRDTGEDAMIMWRTIETSCDDTCAALVTSDGRIAANVISSQGVHDRFGGVVPEIASRHHLELIGDVIDDALARAAVSISEVDLLAVTQGPGLVAALLVGLATAKAIAAAHELPLAPVDHLHGHVAATFLEPDEMAPPFVALIASGGHTFLASVADRGPGYDVLGQTLDDAAGEAFDKGARLLGLGYPGGAALERLARDGDPAAFAFPTGARLGGLDFSFAGLKTALLYRVRELGQPEAQRLRADLAASYQHAIVEALAVRCERALERMRSRRLAIGGGVAANSSLRERLAGLGVQLHVPPRELCTDNAAMIASAARYVEPLPFPDYLGLDVYATGERALAVTG
jgi:N6-L-threonylcarbamoyladenine synthase